VLVNAIAPVIASLMTEERVSGKPAAAKVLSTSMDRMGTVADWSARDLPGI
jgi:hypothetical protein